jgi:integrase
MHHPRHTSIPRAARFQESRLDALRAHGALVNGLRHTYATQLANADVSVYTLMKLLGHESMTTSQRYVSGAGTENRAAVAQNPLYQLIEQPTSNK